jgi:hypothetical protein
VAVVVAVVVAAAAKVAPAMYRITPDRDCRGPVFALPGDGTT